MKMRVLVCGGRDYQDRSEVDRVMSAISGATDVVMHGGATGVDTLVDDWCREHNLMRVVFPALWDKHGKAAGPIRNQQMLDDGKPTIVIAFPGGRGTADMVRRAEAANIKIVKI